MSLSTVQIWQALQEGEIASASDCRQWASEIIKSAGNAALDNPQLLLSQLVKLGRLTPFQANALLSNDTPTLTIGRHRLLAPLSSPALKDWFEAIDPSSNAARWLYSITSERLKESALDRHPPSLKLARQHASVHAAGLQNFSPPAFVDGYLLIAATPADGKPLRETLKNLPRRVMPVEPAIRIVVSLAKSLAALHNQQIVHGRIGIDQVWWDGKENVTLLRDPFFPPVTPLGHDAPTAVGVDNDQDFRVRYAAPEFTAPGQEPTLSTDVYALGCLWWELMMGQLPYSDTMMDQVPTAASKFPLTIPRELGLATGQRRCLEHMLAKNPSNRFANAVALVAALDIVDSNKPAPVARSKSEPLALATGSESAGSDLKRQTVKEPAASAVPLTSDKPVPVASDKPVPVSIVTFDRLAVTTAANRSRKKKSSRPVWLLPAMLGGCVLVLGGLVGILTWNNDTRVPSTPQPKVVENTIRTSTSPESKTETQVAAIPTKNRVTDPIEEQFMIAAGDATLPWVPPRTSQPYSLEMFAPGCQGFVFIRPKGWLDSASGQAIIQSLDPSIKVFWKPIESIVQPLIESTEEIAIGLYPGRSDGWPVLAYRVQLRRETSLEELKASLPNAAIQSVADKHSILVSGEQAIFLGLATQVEDAPRQMMAIGPTALIRELVDIDGGGAPLRRQMEQLWQVSDAKSDLSFLVTTGFFFSDARKVLPTISPRLQTLCRELLDEKTQALLITTSLEPQWYGEIRAMGQSNDDATRFNKDLSERMASIANSVEAELVAAPASPYWRALALRFPQMLRALSRYQRFGIENGQAISNFYLPASASANMTIATWMAIQKPAASASNSAGETTAPVIKKLTGDDLLAHPVSINFEQEPLDSALALLNEEVNRSLPEGSGPIALSIDGKAFELASVTRNQQIRDFRFKDQPLRALLTDLAARVNPDRTVKSLTDEKQAVVWVLTETDGKSTIAFTTRRGIEGTDRKIPKEFSSP
ncbi:MAG: protein kinase [Pirellulaceae bacterium]|nr:protein kinase [Pirellulaceae bacterium]